MPKKFFILIIFAALLTACGAKIIPTENTPTTSPEPSAPYVAQTKEPTQTSTPTQTSEPTKPPGNEFTPVPSDLSIELPVKVSDNGQFLVTTDEEGNPLENGIFRVEFDPERDTSFKLDRPNMPTFSWYLNGSEDNLISEVVIKFAIYNSVPPLHSELFGYDRAFFLTLHNFDNTIPLMPPWPADDIYNSHLLDRGDTDRAQMLTMPELGVDLTWKYISSEGNHITITIPYAEFQGAAKDLTLQFLPGTTFGDLTIRVKGAEGLDSGTIDAITQPVEIPERDLLHDEIMPAFQRSEEDIIPLSDVEGPENINNIMFGQMEGQAINSDGSINMPVSFYDLGEYSGEVQGKYAVVPEGLVPVFMTMSHPGFYDYDQQRQVVDFVFNNMVDENGQFSGVYDIEQGKTVATDRKAAAIPILSAMLSNTDVLTDSEIDFMVNSIIANDLVVVGDTLYYAPDGIGEDGMMDLNLSDFAFNDQFIHLLAEYSNDTSGRLDEEFGGAMLLEGFANSLKLILEGQEQNATRLPSSQLKVFFTTDGMNDALEPSVKFDINNSYFSMGLTTFELFANALEKFKYMDDVNSFNALIGRLSGVKDGEYSESQEQIIREGEAMYAEMYNAFTIVNTYYESCLDVYNFLKVQSSDTIYAYQYNVYTGEKIAAPTDALYPEFHMLAPFINRFGTPGTTMNYFSLAGLFNDETMVKESGHLLIVNFDMYSSEMFSRYASDLTNPDLYADNGFNIWGYDSLRHARPYSLNATQLTRYSFATSGTNMAREDWRKFMMRKLNEMIFDEYDFSINDEFPTFYAHLPRVEIVETE